MSVDHGLPAAARSAQIGAKRMESQLWWNLDGGATPVALRLLPLLAEELAPASNRWGLSRAELAAPRLRQSRRLPGRQPAGRVPGQHLHKNKSVISTTMPV
jgi:hypothetical protein